MKNTKNRLDKENVDANNLSQNQPFDKLCAICLDQFYNNTNEEFMGSVVQLIKCNVRMNLNNFKKKIIYELINNKIIISSACFSRALPLQVVQNKTFMSDLSNKLSSKSKRWNLCGHSNEMKQILINTFWDTNL